MRTIFRWMCVISVVILMFLLYKFEFRILHGTDKILFKIKCTAEDSNTLEKPKYFMISGKKNGTNASNHQNSKQYLILFWGIPDFLKKYPNNATIPPECGNCARTSDRNKLKDSDVLLFASDTLRDDEGVMPQFRSPNQIYVFYTLENPYYTKHDRGRDVHLEKFRNSFNLTMTYRRDSDMVLSYGIWDEQMLELMPPFSLKLKKNLALMMASAKVRVGSRLRIKLSDALIKAGLNLTRYGKSFGSRYEGNVTELLQSYKFFMEFENSIHCKDYITEKFWFKSLWHGVVPVVWGPLKEDVIRVAPPNSFIHVDDFETLEDLVKYLNYLHSHDNEYLKYFEWRNLKPPERQPHHYCIRGTAGLDEKFCGICRSITDGLKGRENFSLTKWWYGGENPECLNNNFTAMEKYFDKKYNINNS